MYGHQKINVGISWPESKLRSILLNYGKLVKSGIVNILFFHYTNKKGVRHQKEHCIKKVDEQYLEYFLPCDTHNIYNRIGFFFL